MKAFSHLARGVCLFGLCALILVCGGSTKAKADFAYAVAPTTIGSSSVDGESNGTPFNSTLSGGSPISQTYTFNPGTSGTNSTTLYDNSSLSASSFTDTFNGSSSSSASNNGTGPNANTDAVSNLQWNAVLTIDQTSLATVSYYATSFSFGDFNVPGDGYESFDGFTLLTDNNFNTIALVEGQGYENISANTLSNVSAGITSYSVETGTGAANSVSAVLAPGTYILDAHIESEAFLENGAGDVDPFTSGYGSITINALSTPEPGSLVLLGLGALGLVGAANRKRWRRILKPASNAAWRVCLFGLCASIMAYGGMGRARADFTYSVAPSTEGQTQISGESNNTPFYSLQTSGSPISATYTVNAGTSGTTSTTLDNSWSLGASSFTDTFSGSSSSSASNDGTGVGPNTICNSYLEWGTLLTIDQTSLATVSYSATSFTFGAFNVPGGSGTEGFYGLVGIYDPNGDVELEVNGTGSEDITNNTLSNVFAGIFSNSPGGMGTANSVSTLLAPGTYYVTSKFVSDAFIEDSDGYVDPYTSGFGSITIDGLSPTPEPASLILLGIGAVSLVGATGRRRGQPVT